MCHKRLVKLIKAPECTSEAIAHNSSSVELKLCNYAVEETPKKSMNREPSKCQSAFACEGQSRPPKQPELPQTKANAFWTVSGWTMSVSEWTSKRIKLIPCLVWKWRRPVCPSMTINGGGQCQSALVLSNDTAKVIMASSIDVFA